MSIISPSPSGAVQDALLSLAAAVDRLASLTDPSAAARVEGAEAASVVIGALALAGRLSAVAARTLPVVEADGWWSLEGARSITSWVAAGGRVSHGQAARLVGLGRALRDDLPRTAVDAVSGAVCIEAAHVLATVANTPARAAALAGSAQDCGEEFLVEHARELSIGQLRVLARRWANYADPDADERGYREASDREFLDLANTLDGWHLTGFLTTEHGHALTAALDAVTGRSADQAGQPAGRRRATALNNLVRTVLDRDLTAATGDHRPQVTVVTDLATLHRALGGEVSGHTSSTAARPARPLGSQLAGDRRVGSGGSRRPPPSDSSHRPGGAGASDCPEEPPEDGRRAGRPPLAAGPPPSSDVGKPLAPLEPCADVERFAVAELVGTGPIPDSVLARLACDSQITRVVFGAGSVVLNAGRAERTYTGAKRRAIIARDGLCRFPGCAAPPGMSEVHHTDHWVRDQGETDVHTGVLICWYHHELIHARRIEVRRCHDGRWQFVDAHGREMVVPIG